MKRSSLHKRSGLKPVFMLALAMLVAGCSFAPKDERPAAPVGAAFPGLAGGAGASAPDTPWSEFFPDPRLKSLIAQALENNRDLRVATLAIEQARAQFDIRRADAFPTVGVAAQAQRAPGLGGTQQNTFTAGLAVTSWEIDFFGRIASLSRAALAQYLATAEGREAAQTALVASVASTWIGLIADEELLAITRDTLRTREETQRLTKLRFDAGATSEIEFQQARSLYETARVALAQQARQKAIDLNALTLLVGGPLPTDVPPAGAYTAQIELPKLAPGLPAESLVRRPDVRQAERQLEAANANIGAARAAFFPRIALTASAGNASSELSGLFKGGNFVYTVAPSLLLPIFDAGRNRANLALANATRDAAVAQYERAVQSAFRDVADALAGQTLLVEQLDAQRKVAEAEGVRLKLAQLRYDNGVASFLDLLDAQRSQFAARQAEVQTRTQQLQNQVQLYRVLGGGGSVVPAGGTVPVPPTSTTAPVR